MSFERAMICLDGTPPSSATLKKTLKPTDCIIAADGAANWLHDYKITPHFIMGDLDGVRKEVLAQVPKASVIKKEDQNSTDLEKAFSWATRKKIPNVVVTGIAGKRIDHTLSNFSLLWKFHKKTKIEIVDDEWRGTLLSDGDHTFDVVEGMTISLIPYSNCSGLSLTGFQYSLTEATMKLGEVGISNVALNSKVRIELQRGRMLAIFLSKSS